MADFAQFGPITTLHDLGNNDPERLEQRLVDAAENYRIGLVLPVTAADMRAEAFGRIVNELSGARFIERIVVTMGVAPNADDYRETARIVSALGDRVRILWTDGPRIQKLYSDLIEAGMNVSVPGKGRSVWTAFGYLLADSRLKAFALHDCDIVGYRRDMLARLCFPMAEPALDFEFCKAYYARYTNKLHGRVVRLLVRPLVQSLMQVIGPDPFLIYMDGFRYPLSGEFAVTSNLARSNRIPSDWGLEVGTLAEVYRNTSLKRVCQVDLCPQYEHKHQSLSSDDPDRGLMKMATDILTSMYRTVAAMGTRLGHSHFVALRSVYLRTAQDAIRQYHADSLFNGLDFDRDGQEQAVDSFAERITAAGELFLDNPSGGRAIPNWTRVLSAFPNFPQRLSETVEADAAEFAV